MNRCVIAEFACHDDVQGVVETLEKSISPDAISVVSRMTGDLHGELGKLKKTDQDAEDVGTAAASGALLGTAVATPLSLGTMIGPFFIVGPILGAGIGAAVGSLLSGSKEWGVDADSASDYEARVRGGRALVIVSGENADVVEARQLLPTFDPISINEHARSE